MVRKLPREEGEVIDRAYTGRQVPRLRLRQPEEPQRSRAGLLCQACGYAEGAGLKTEVNDHRRGPRPRACLRFVHPSANLQRA
ncbi:protein of unknown function [Methanoculleus bourgensis]|uniref:Uncharacterized protein n=1 Tax=Methanoculleus bourgensis TaxID=83986 RepID=A0A0X3BMW8_9EURY|nr:protein of unknown function [Methanoculleus bourgensis]